MQQETSRFELIPVALPQIQTSQLTRFGRVTHNFRPFLTISCQLSLVPRPSLSLSFALTILEAEKKELVKREEGLVKLITCEGRHGVDMT